MEPRRNIRFRCERHRSHPNPAYVQKPFDWFVGKFCKLAFLTGLPNPDKELMWVKVTESKEIDGKTMLVGILNNDPIYVKDYACDDGVAFDRCQLPRP